MLMKFKKKLVAGGIFSRILIYGKFHDPVNLEVGKSMGQKRRMKERKK